MQECIICKKRIDLSLSKYAEHFRSHERRNEDIQHGGRVKCGFCGSGYPSVEKLLQHLVAFHQVPEPKIQILEPRINTTSTLQSRNGRSNTQPMIEKSNKVLLLMDKDKKVDGALNNAKEKIVEQLQSVMDDYKNNVYISEQLSDEISKSLLETFSTTIQLMGNVIKECSLKDYSDKISSFHDEIILSFTDNNFDQESNNNFDEDEESNNSAIKQELPIMEEEVTSEFSPPLQSDDFPSTSNATTSATMNETFDPIPALNRLLNRPSIALDSTINAKEGIKKLANEMIDECQEFYVNNKPEESDFGDVDVYAEFDSPIGRIILYILFHDSNPEFSKELITIAWKETYGILRIVLKAVKPNLDYRPKDLDPLVSQFMKFIGKEGTNNEIAQAETKKILHQWIRTTRHRSKDHDTSTTSKTPSAKTVVISTRKKRKAPSTETIESLAEQSQALIPDLSKIIYLFRRSASMRFEWIENTPGADINLVLETFTVIKMFPKQLTDIDYEELCNIKKWEYISIVDEMQRILPALKYLLQSYNVTTLPTNLNQNDTFAHVFSSFPNLFHHFLNNSKKVPKPFYFESAAQDFLTGSLLEALEFYYRIHYVYRIERPASIFFLTSWLDLLCKKKVETNCGPQRFMREIERLMKQYENYPEFF
uniref:C2H2-type domain-containing protein n=1 Tax=Panagrolaimus sp. PS1159 TaxID=55785 RepID=A0AC35G4X4_9BILA